MKKSEKDITSTLQQLTQFVNDAQITYEKAVKETGRPPLQRLYRLLLSQRAEHAMELNQIIESHHGQAETGTSEVGQLYRQWLDFKADYNKSKEKNLVDLTLFGEEWIQKAYQEALEEETLPLATRQVLERQRLACLLGLEKLQDLKNNPDPAADP